MLFFVVLYDSYPKDCSAFDTGDALRKNMSVFWYAISVTVAIPLDGMMKIYLENVNKGRKNR
jgi:hypothetical protein